MILVEDIDRILKVESGSGNDAPTAPRSLSVLEKDHILDILNQAGWVRNKAARMLGISLPTLRSKMRKYQIESAEKPEN